MSVTTVEDAYCRQVMPTADKKCQTYVHEKCQPNEAVNGCYALCKNKSKDKNDCFATVHFCIEHSSAMLLGNFMSLASYKR